MSESNTPNDNLWFYEDDGQRKGPFSSNQIIDFVKNSTIHSKTLIWKKGLSDWIAIESTEFNVHAISTTPPPLYGDKVNNNIVWVLAFAPLIGYTIEWIIAGLLQKNEYAANLAMENNKYWFVTVILNIGLALIDEKRLQSAGHNTEKFKGWAWIVPVYLYQRSKATHQNLSYFITWIVCFVLTLI